MVDLSRYLPGPLAARLLGDLGARVIKVEEPRLGDPVRQAPPLVAGASSLATLLLSGHESLALDLSQPAGREALLGLLATADVLVESFRPGTLARFGLAPAELRQRFPRLVICSLTGWGQDGPHAGRAGHDLTYQAIAGSLAATGKMPATQTADVVGAWSAVTSILAALWARQRSGDGCWIDQSLTDAAMHAHLTAWASEAEGPQAMGEALPLTGALPCYNLYPTKDGGLLALAALEPKFWRRFCQAAGRPDLVASQYKTTPEAIARVTALVASRSRAEWAELMQREDLPGEPVLTPAEALAHPQATVRETVWRGGDGRLRLAYPACFDGVRPRTEAPLAELGADSERLVAEFALAPGLSRRRQQRAGIGRRPSVQRWLLRSFHSLRSRFRRRPSP